MHASTHWPRPSRSPGTRSPGSPLLTRTGDAAYEHLAELLLSARALGTEGEFTAYMTTLRTTQKRKRKLMAMPGQHGM
ncbi:hypothetical protein AB0F18_28715 [Streptomyces sp. NPDC029216]|uniref:hypothetical protein n=1 Tax=Streptomyces sp. NPDC029216 TaxID=3154701 RepID=UPI0033DDCC15